ncbi:GTPase activating protein (GAP) for Rho1p [Coniothyrium glycines]
MPVTSTHGHPHTPRVRNGEPQPALAATPEPASSRRDLTSWWRQFSKTRAKKEDEKELTQGIFGVPLIQSIPYANVAISLFNEHGESYIYGYVPIVVAKCGVYLKEKATDVEGIFRLAGSEKRIKELKLAFDTPPRYGKGLDWTGYTVHDAANILRRYFNNLPEPIIPLQHYDPFRQPLRDHQAEAVGPIEGQAPSVGDFDPDAAVRVYQHQIKALPSLNRQLLLYILDLLAVFAAKADVNKMTTSNLAAIFQPGILSHPQHDMSPQDYRLSQDVLIFLIDNQDHFLIGMEGTAVDEGTLKHVESGPPTPQARTPTTPGRNGSGIGRSASAASSAGAESLRKYGGVRRNVSTSSKRSRHSGAVPSPVIPAFVSTPSSAVHRSNTLPSKRSPALGSPRFPPAKHSGPTTPVAEEVTSPLSSTAPADSSPSTANAKQEPEQSERATESVQSSEPSAHVLSTAQADTESVEPMRPVEVEPEPVNSIRAQTLPPQKIQMPQPFAPVELPQSQTAVLTPAVHQLPGAFPLPSPGIIPPSQPVTPSSPVQAVVHSLSPHRAATPIQRSPQRSPFHTPTRERSEFMEAPVDSGPTGDFPPAVRTFTQILSKVAASPSSSDSPKDGRKPNKLQKKRLPNSANMSAHSSTHSLTGGDYGHVSMSPPLDSPLQPPHPPFAQGQASSSREGLHQYNSDTVSSRNSGTTLKPSMSPSNSFRSHSTATELSEAEQAELQPREEKRSFWKGHKRAESKATPTASQTDLHGCVPGADKSMSSFGSSSGWGGGGRRSLQYDSNQSSETSMMFGSPPDSDKSEKKGAFAWVHKMRQDHRDRADKRERAKSPPGSSSYLHSPQNSMQPPEDFAARGRSMDIPRSTDNTKPKVDQSNDVTPTGSIAVPPAATSKSSEPAALPAETQPRLGSMALRTDLPAALTEPRSVARSPDRTPISPTVAGTSSQVSFPTWTPEPATFGSAVQNSVPVTADQSVALGQDVVDQAAPGPIQFSSKPAGAHHASSDSTITITPGQVASARADERTEERPADVAFTETGRATQ